MVTTAAAQQLARLARLHLEDGEVDRLVTELSSILAHVEELRGAPVDGVEAAGGAAEGSARLRADVPGADPLRVAPADLAPAWCDGFFTVPRLPALDAGAESAP
ncbi:MAG: Asp-tRNA(Asn)/Glu-tRNA(Gln) amidotransferase subunit GatC [Longimicrobiales bacterium]